MERGSARVNFQLLHPAVTSPSLDSVIRLPPMRRWAHAALLRLATAAVGRRSDGPVALGRGAGAAVVTEHRHRRVRARRAAHRPDAARRRQHLTALSQLVLLKINVTDLARKPTVPADIEIVVKHGRPAVICPNLGIVYGDHIVNSTSEKTTRFY